ncbi:histidine phosphatase superfamily [Trichoderma novae-zelandiae]
MLTDRGRETTYALGTRLRRLYVDHLGFLPASIRDASSFMYLRATPIPRALESMQQAFLGLYPPHTRDADFPPLNIVSRHSPEETLFPNDMHCRRFAELSRAFAQRAAERWNETGEMDYLTTKLGKYMPDDGPQRVAVDSKPRLSGIMDTINATLAHGPATKLPRDFYDPKARQIIEKVSVDEWFAGYGESREYRALGIGALLGDVVARMVTSAQRNVPPADAEFVHPPGQHRPSSSSLAGTNGSRDDDDAAIRFGLSGCHDTTLAGILASLGAYNTESWPPFTSHIAIELFRSSDKPPASPSSPSTTTSWWPSFLSPKQPQASISRKPTPALTPAEKQALEGYYVRLRYNDEPVAIPGCGARGNHFPGHESFCTLAAFKGIVDRFTPRDWQAECRANIKKAAFPEVKEPAGY